MNIEEQIYAAQAELEALCEGKKFQMCIPAQDDDSDIVIGAGLQAGLEAIVFADKFASLVKELREMINLPAVVDVLEERRRQEQKWGEQNHDPFTYLTILMEEVGEFAQAALHTKYGGKQGGAEHLREEAIHTAAVALAVVECLDRDKWKWPEVRSTE